MGPANLPRGHIAAFGRIAAFGSSLTTVGRVMSLLSAHQTGRRVAVPAAGTTASLDSIATLEETDSPHGQYRRLRVSLINLNAVGWVGVDVAVTVADAQPVGIVAITTLAADGYGEAAAFESRTANLTLHNYSRVLLLHLPPFSVTQDPVTVD